MAGQSPALSLDLLAFSERLLRQRSMQACARAIAQHVSDCVPDSAVIVYVAGTSDGEDVWLPKAVVGDVNITDSFLSWEDESGLSILVERRRPILLPALGLRRELYSHLHIKRTFSVLAYVPLISEEEWLGAIEIVSFTSELDAELISALQPLVRLAAIAMAACKEHEQEQNAALSSIARLTQLYDLEKTFSSTLEMQELLPIIGSKFRELLACRAINLWLLQPDESVSLAHQSGADPTSHEAQIQTPGQGLVGDVSDSGESLLITSADDERLRSRNSTTSSGAVKSLMIVPLMDGESLVGVVEAVNRNDGAPFDEDDLFALTRISETAVGALRNASLLLTERKVELLETLVRVSSEITSTLDIDRVLQAIVNGAASVIPYERAAIALELRGRFQLKAISGQPEFDLHNPQLKALEEILRWATLSGESILVQRKNGDIKADREETRAKFAAYFDASGMAGFHAVPLRDEEGSVGILSFESVDPDFLSDAHLEVIKVLASQATVALRNASLYREVPFINVLEPLIQRKRRFLALERRRRTTIMAICVAATLFLFLFPLPYRVEGNALVSPIQSARIQPQIEGVIRQVYVREGDAVRKGTLIAEMQDGEFRAALAAAQSKLDTALGAMNRALAGSDGTEAGIQRNEAAFWSAEVARARERLEATRLRSPIDGVVATPHVEDFTGKRLEFGDPFAEVIDSAQTSVDVAIDEQDVGLLQKDNRTWIKLDSFPNHTFQGRVAIISPKADVQDRERVFFARVVVANDTGKIRAGMQGRGKVFTAWRPAGVVLFRRPAIAVWTRLWSIFGW